jgi:hypothetical protein
VEASWDALKKLDGMDYYKGKSQNQLADGKRENVSFFDCNV